MAKKKEGEPRRESHSGFHMFNLYQLCPRKWYTKYVLGIIPFFTSPPLILGAAFHEGKAIWYLKKKENASLKTFTKEILSRKKEYELREDMDRDLERGSLMLASWIQEQGYRDLDIYNVLAVEEMIEATLPNGFILTVRPDTCLETKSSSQVFIMESKSSGWRVDVTEMGVRYGDQATSYIWATKQKHPDWNIEGVVPDVTCWSKTSSRSDKIINYRGDIVFRKERQLWEFEQGVMGILVEIAQKTKAVKSGSFDPSQLFPRNTQWCVSYNRPCEYNEICRKDLTSGKIPPGFKKDSWAEERSILEMKSNLKGEKYEKGPKKSPSNHREGTRSVRGRGKGRVPESV
jgi:hypothetical protein